jgi:hypothetical protein
MPAAGWAMPGIKAATPWSSYGLIYLYLAVLLAILLGWATNCLPAALPARLALVVAAYSDGDKDFIAASGK